MEHMGQSVLVCCFVSALAAERMDEKHPIHSTVSSYHMNKPHCVYIHISATATVKILEYKVRFMKLVREAGSGSFHSSF